MYNPFTLEGKVILVTGASSGIGRQCAVDCSKMGAKVVAVARNLERLESLMDEMEGKNDYVSFDLNKIGAIKDLISSIVKKHGRLDGFIHAAGLEVTVPIKLTKPEQYESLYRVNCMSAFEIVKNLCGIKSFNKGGSIVFISSITSVISRNGLSAYAASKGALVSAAKVMATEMASHKVRVNAISPGTILTTMMQNALAKMSEEDKKKRVEGFPLGLGQTTDISNACIYLLSDASRWITGQNIIIDGGYTIK